MAAGFPAARHRHHDAPAGHSTPLMLDTSPTADTHSGTLSAEIAPSNTGTAAAHQLHRRVDLLLRTGQILVASMANTDRIMRNMKRVAAYLGIPDEKLHIYVNFNMLMVNVSDDEHSFSKFQRVDTHSVNMHAITEISLLSWRAIEQDYSLERYEEELERIRTRKRNYSPLQVAVGAGFACGGFCIQFGCDWVAFFYASLAAIIGMLVRDKCNAGGLNHLIGIGVAAFASTLIAWATTLLPGSWTDTPWHPLLACALFIVPGVPLINFVDDMISGHTQIGIIRAVNTLLIVSAMAFGIAAAVHLCRIQDFFPTISIVPHHNYWEYATAAAISAVGFSMIFNIQRRLLLIVAIGGILAVCTRNYINLGPSTDNIGLDMGLVAGSFAGAALISIIAVKAVHWFHVPNHVLTIPAVIPMIPGVLMYRMLFGLINSRVTTIEQVTPVMKAVDSGITSGLVIMSIALGVALPTIIGRKYIAVTKQRRLEALLRERRANGKFINW